MLKIRWSLLVAGLTLFCQGLDLNNAAEQTDVERRAPGLPLGRVRRAGFLDMMALGNPAFAATLVVNKPSEQIPTLIEQLSGRAILRVSERLNQTERMRVLHALNATQIMTLTGRMTPTEEAELLSLLPNEGVVSLALSLSSEQLGQLLLSLPAESVVNLTETLAPEENYEIMSRLSGDDVVALLKNMSASQSSAVLNRLPLEGVLNITQSLTSDQLGELMTYLPTQGVLTLVLSFPKDDVTSLLVRLPIESVRNLTMSFYPSQLVELLSNLSIEAVLNITNALTPEQLGDMVIRLSPSSLSNLINRLPDVSFVEKLLSEIPFSAILHVTDSIPRNFMEIVFGSIHPEVIATFLQKATSEELSAMLGKIPSQVLVYMLIDLPHNATLGVIQNLSNDTLSNVTTTLTPEQLVELLTSLPDNIIGALLKRIPAQNIVDLMRPLSATVLTNLTSSLSANIINTLVKNLLKDNHQALVNLTASLPPQAVANILFKLEDAVVEKIISAIPQDVLHKLISDMPIDTVLGLTNVLPGSFITNLPVSLLIEIVMKIPGQKLIQLVNELLPGGPLSLLQMIPQDMLQGLLGSVKPAQIQTMLAVIPNVSQLVGGLLPDLLTQTTAQMNSLQFGQLLQELGRGLRPVLPTLRRDLARLLANVSAFPDLADLRTSALGLALSVVENVPLASLLALVGPLVPELPVFAARYVDGLANHTASADSPQLDHCVQDIRLYLTELGRGASWAVDMFDASGKPGRGIHKGNTHMHGNFDQCVQIDFARNHSRSFRGKYCGVEIGLPPGVLPPVPGTDLLELSVDCRVYCQTSWWNCTYACPALVVGQSCPYSHQQLPLNITIPRVSCQEDKTLPGDRAAIGAICVLSVLGLLVFIGTVLDIIQQQQRLGGDDANDDSSYDLVGPKNKRDDQPYDDVGQKNKADSSGVEDVEEISVDVGKGEKQTSFSIETSNGTPAFPATPVISLVPTDDENNEDRNGGVLTRAFLAFSLPSNTFRILGTDDVSDSVTCLHGIRAFSILWIIVGHSFYYMATYFENALGAAEALETVLGQVVINSTLAVDSFLLISGCLTALIFLCQTRSQGGVKVKNLAVFFVHRYLRLTPAYAIAIMAFTCLLPYLSDGPNWTRDSTEFFSPCKSYWWTSLLYVNNFYKDLGNQCVPWGWYLSTDLQLHWIVAPIIIVGFAVGFKIITSLLIGGLVLMQIVLTVYYQNEINGDYLRNREEFWWKVFEKPYTRLAPFVLGLGLGFMLAVSESKRPISKALACVGWLWSIAICFAAVLLKYDDNHVMLQQPFHWPEWARASYEALYRPFFSLAVCVIVYLCNSGRGGFINSILSWKVFIPVSRLAFCMYLLHPAVILADMWQTRVPPYFTVGYVLLRASGYIMVSAIFAFFLSVTVELPVLRLAKTFLRRR